MFDQCRYSHEVECPQHCRHAAGAPNHEPMTARGTICRWNVAQDVADWGPGTIPPLTSPVTTVEALDAADAAYAEGYGAGYGDEFGRAAQRTLNEVREVFDARGRTYGDTWAIGPVYGPSTARERLDDCASLINVKIRRSLSATHSHRDSLIDLIAYAAAYVTWADEEGVWA